METCGINEKYAADEIKFIKVSNAMSSKQQPMQNRLDEEWDELRVELETHRALQVSVSARMHDAYCLLIS